MQSTADSQRILGFDVARSFAILGMVIVHFSLVMGTSHDSSDGFAVLFGFLDGRATAMFVILAGIGVTLMSRRAIETRDVLEIARVQNALVRRGLFLLALGFVNLLIWPGDILRVYGVSLLLASRLIGTSNLRLLLGAVAFEVGFVILFFTIDFESHWEWSTMTYHGLWTPTGILRNLFYDGFRSVFPWTGFFLFGMWLGRQKLTENAVNRQITAVAIVTAVSAETISWLCVTLLNANSKGMPPETIQALFGTESMPALPLFVLASGGLAVAIVAGTVWLVDAFPILAWQPLAATGQMALTWYFAHIVLGLGGIVALDLVASRPLPVAAGCAAGFFAVAVLASSLWKMRFRHGPLEWTMRQLSA